MKNSVKLLINQDVSYIVDANANKVVLLGRRREDFDEFFSSFPSGASLQIYLNTSVEDYEYEHFRSASFFDRKALIKRTVRKLGVNESKFVRHAWIGSPNEKDKKGTELEIAHIKESQILEMAIESAHDNGILVSSIHSLVDEWRRFVLCRSAQIFSSVSRSDFKAFIVAIEASNAVRIIAFERNGKILANLFFENESSVSSSMEKVLRYIKTQHPALVDETAIVLASDEPLDEGLVKDLVEQEGFVKESVALLSNGEEGRAAEQNIEDGIRGMHAALRPLFQKAAFDLRGFFRKIPYSRYEDKVSTRVLKTRNKALFGYVVFFLTVSGASSLLVKDYFEMALIEKSVRGIEEKRVDIDRITDSLRRVIKLPYETKDMNLVLDFSKRFEKAAAKGHVGASDATRIVWGAFLAGRDGQSITPVSYKIARNYKDGDFISSRFIVSARANAVSTETSLKSKNDFVERAVRRLMDTGCFENVNVTLRPGSASKGNDDAFSISESLYNTKRFSFGIEGVMDLKRQECVVNKKKGES